MGIWYNILMVWLGGGLGAVARYCLQIPNIFNVDKYYTTMGINITGSFIIGILWALLLYFETPKGWYSLLITGFLGGYTTFSTFSLDAVLLANNGKWITMLGYIAFTLIGGVLSCALGVYGTTKILKII